MGYKANTLRAGRCSQSGSAYLVTVNTENRSKRFHDWVSARPAIHALRASDEALLTETYAWVVMPAHIHWLFTLGPADLGTVVGRMKSRSTVAINKQTEGCSKKVWQKGYYDRRPTRRCSSRACPRLAY